MQLFADRVKSFAWSIHSTGNRIVVDCWATSAVQVSGALWDTLEAESENKRFSRVWNIKYLLNMYII